MTYSPYSGTNYVSMGSLPHDLYPMKDSGANINVQTGEQRWPLDTCLLKNRADGNAHDCHPVPPSLLPPLGNGEAIAKVHHDQGRRGRLSCQLSSCYENLHMGMI